MFDFCVIVARVLKLPGSTSLGTVDVLPVLLF